MTPEKLNRIKENVAHQAQVAQKILEGDRDNYDGADGARYIAELCQDCNELIAEIEKI